MFYYIDCICLLYYILFLLSYIIAVLHWLWVLFPHTIYNWLDWSNLLIHN